MAAARQLIGIKRRGPSWFVNVRVPWCTCGGVHRRGHLHTATFEVDTPIAEMVKWRIDEIDKHTLQPTLVARGSLAADVVTHLAMPAIAKQPYVKQRGRHLAYWIAELGGDRPRGSVKREEVEAIIQKWLLTLAPATVYHRRSALLVFFTMIDALTDAQRRAGLRPPVNPVEGTTCPPAWTPRDQSVPFDTLLKIWETMPTHHTVHGVRVPSLARLVVGVILHTGVRAADLKRVRRSDIDWLNATVQMPGTLKGRRGNGGALPWTLDLSHEGLDAFRAFDAANAYGRFSPESVTHSYKRAARRVDGPHTAIHLYCQRHSLGAQTHAEGVELATIGRLLGHAPGSRATMQYARGAHAVVNRAALTALSDARRASVGTKRCGTNAANRRHPAPSLSKRLLAKQVSKVS